MPLSAELIANDAPPASSRPALEAVGISKSYLRGSRWFGKGTAFTAVRSATLRILPKEILALVGESGSGKTTLGKIIVGIERADKGSVRIGSETVFDTLTGTFVPPAKRKIGLIFQDPSSSLNPRMRVRELVGEGLELAGASKSERSERTIDSLQRVGLLKTDLDSYPHQFSGGQRQRIAIARAIATRPKFLIADESVSALDVSVQLQILNLLLDLRDSLELTIIFITHNIAVVEYLCDRVAIMCKGEIVEQGNTREVIGSPEHYYTKRLLSAVPRL